MTFYIRTILMLLGIGAACCACSAWIERADAIEIYSAGQRYSSAADYRQHQLQHGAGTLSFLGDTAASSVALQELEYGRNIFIQAQDHPGKSAISDDLGQIEQMFQKFKEDYAGDEDIQVDLSKLKTITVGQERVYVIPQGQDGKTLVQRQSDFILRNNELSRVMRTVKIRKAVEQMGALSGKGYQPEVLQNLPAFLSNDTEISAQHLRDLLKRSISLKSEAAERHDQRPPVTIEREAHLKNYFINSPTRN